MACTLQQIAKWKSKRNPLETVMGGAVFALPLLQEGKKIMHK